MSDPIRKLIKKIRQIPAKPIPPPEPVWKRLAAEARAKEYMAEFWERDKERNRSVAFEKANLKLEEWRAEQRAIKEAREELAANRLKWLAKGRKKLKRMREADD